MKVNLKKRVLAWINILRVGNCIALGYAAIVGYMLGVEKILDLSTLVKLFVSAFIIGGSSNIINDYFDAPIDSINKPWRPIPSGLIKATVAYAVAIAMGVIGIVIAFTINSFTGAIALAAFILSYLYSYKLKKVLIIGNLVVAFLAALSIAYGGLASPNIRIYNVVIATLYAFLLNLGREFLKGIEDVEGDKKYEVSTLATVYGVKTAYISSLITFLILIVLSIVPYLLLGYSLYYLAIAIFGVDLIIVVSLLIASSFNPRDALKATKLLKLAVFNGITAFLIEALRIY